VSTVAVIGAGQLGQMLGEAAAFMGVTCRYLDPAERPPAATAGDVLRYGFDDAEGLDRLVADAEVLTYEFENVPVATVRVMEKRLAVYPPPGALEKAQDRLEEKRLFDELGIPTSPFAAVDSDADAGRAADSLGLPLVFKTRRLGYDGKGQAIARDAADLDGLYASLGGVPLIAERFIEFDREVSIIGARTPGGTVVTWPLAENRHLGGILRVSRAPFENAALTRMAGDYHRRMLESLEYVGVLALELFVVGDRLLANEFAPRVHNSGHWTIEGAKTSQFENHLRAILDLPPGDTAAVGHSAMVNIIGNTPRRIDEAASLGAQVHDYGKAPRPGRKLGHLTLVRDSAAARDRALEALLTVLADD